MGKVDEGEFITSKVKISKLYGLAFMTSSNLYRSDDLCLLHLNTFFWLIVILRCNFIYYLFILLFMAVLALHFCARAFPSCGKRASHCGGF